MTTIAEAVFLQADFDLHMPYISEVMRRRNDYLNNRPRIDTREDLHYLVEDLDRIYEKHCSRSGVALRKMILDVESHDLRLSIPDVGPPPWK